MIRIACSLLVAAYAVFAAAQTADSRSGPLARRLADVLTRGHLEAIAAVDPSVPDRFVAALLFPDVQLLVVAGRYPAADALRAQLAARQYKDVYLELTGGSARDSRIFFQDLKADGLHPDSGGDVDVMYEHVDKQTILDGKPDKARFNAADQEYARLLTLLVNEASNVVPTGD
jgi:hypothetical protein